MRINTTILKFVSDLNLCDKHLTHNTQSGHGGYKMQVTMTIPNWDLILNPFTRAFYTDYVGELKKAFQQKDCFRSLLI